MWKRRRLYNNNTERNSDMALCRCLEAHSWPRGITTEYIGYVKPVGYPSTALVCGLCDNPGVIWLNTNEQRAYESGVRIFEGPNKFAKMKADDSGITYLKRD